MPTYTIGTGSPFVANATTSSTFSGQPGTAYNATWQYFTYDVPISTNTGNVTVYFNSSWIPANIYPSTFLPIAPGEDFLTILDTKGYSSVQVQFIEPSSLIGTTTFNTISYITPPGISLLAGLTVNRVAFTPYGTSTTTIFNTTTTNFEAPYGSTVAVSVFNQWQQQIGHVTNYLMANSSSSISVTLNVTQINFEFVNSSSQYVYIKSQNGYNISAFNSAVVANNTLYDWSAQYFSLASGQAQYKHGSISTNQPQMPLYIYLNTPPAELEVTADAYNGSNLGSITTAGNPRVQMSINGQPYSSGSTFVGFMGSTYAIRVADLLNQTLVANNITLISSFTSIVETVPLPSYTLGVENEEQVPTTSPLATEHVMVNSTSGQSYNFTDGIGQNVVMYLKAGNYHIYMHDNLTGNFNVSLSQNAQLYAFGPALLNNSEFQTAVNKLLNDTSGLSLQTVSSSSGIEPGQVAIYSVAVNYVNGTAVSQSFLQNSTIDVLVHNNSNGALASMYTSTAISGNLVTVSITPPASGSYSVSITVIHSPLSGQLTYSLLVQSIVQVSRGMRIAATGPSNVQEDLVWNYTISVDYANGTAMNLNDTKSVYNNLTMSIFNGIDPIQQIQKISYHAGYIFINVTFNQTGGFTLYISSSANLNGYASGTALVPIQVYAASVEPISSQIAANTQIIAGTANSMMVGLEYQNGSYLPLGLTHLFYLNATVNLYLNGIFYESLTPVSYSASVIFFDLNLSGTGNYTFDFQAHANGLSTLAVSHTSVVKVVPSREGLRMSIAGSNQMYTKQASNYTISLEYANRTALSLAATKSVELNLTYAVLNGLDPTYNVRILGYAAGLIFISYSSNITGVYTLYFQSYANLEGYASDTVIFPVSIENVSYALHVAPLSPPASLIVGENSTIIFSVDNSNFTASSLSFLQSSILKVMMTNQLGAISLNYTVSITAGNITITVHNVPAGNYTLSLTVSNGNYAGNGFYKFSSAPLVKVSNGLRFTFLPPTSNEVQAGVRGNITLLAEYSNRTLLNMSDTRELITGKYLEVLLFRNNQPIGPIVPVLQNNGEFLLPYNFTTLANYTMVVSALNVPIGRANTSASNYLMVQAVSYDPSAPPLTGIDKYLYAIANNISIILGILTGATAIVYFLYRFFRKRALRKAKKKDTFETIVQALSIYEHLKKDSELIYANIPISITEAVTGAVAYPQAKHEGFDYVLSRSQQAKIEDTRKRGDIK